MKESDEITELMGAQNRESEIKDGIKELFKDEWNPEQKQHDIDLRTRLDRVEIRSMAIVSFLQSIDIPEGREQNKVPNLATGLLTLMKSIKRHKISLKGKSRQEIIQLFQTRNTDKEVKKSFLEKYDFN